MIRFVLRRLLQAILTVLGVMIVTFVLFRGVAGDIAAAHLGTKATEQSKAAWRHRHGYDRPLVLNVHRRLKLTDRTKGEQPLLVLDIGDGKMADRLAMLPSDVPKEARNVLLGRYLWALDSRTPITRLTGEEDLRSDLKIEKPPADTRFRIQLSDGSGFIVDASNAETCGELLDIINHHGENRAEDSTGRLVEATIADWTFNGLADSQFVGHLRSAALFQSRSLKDNRKLTEIIAKRAPKSLALTIPAMAIGWFLAMVISCFVAYYRGRVMDKVGVFLSVLGMCIPFLAFMIYGQALMFRIAPAHAYGLSHRANVYVPVMIMVVAGLGASVRFYRTVILDEVNRDYVRTALAKGATLPSVLFKHVLKNCMLPILTNLILSIPFLIMGSLLVESYFGIPGLGDLMITSINGRDEPIMSGLVFLSALIYTVGVLVTDVSYVVFDPRIRLR